MELVIETRYLIMEIVDGLLKIPKDEYSNLYSVYGYQTKKEAKQAIIDREDYARNLVIIERPELYKV